MSQAFRFALSPMGKLSLLPPEADLLTDSPVALPAEGPSPWLPGEAAVLEAVPTSRAGVVMVIRLRCHSTEGRDKAGLVGTFLRSLRDQGLHGLSASFRGTVVTVFPWNRDMGDGFAIALRVGQECIRNLSGAPAWTAQIGLACFRSPDSTIADTAARAYSAGVKPRNGHPVTIVAIR